MKATTKTQTRPSSINNTKPSTYFPKRYLMVSGTFILALILYIDRVCMSVAKETVGIDLNLSDKQMGWVLSAFAFGYAVMQTPAGIISDKYGPRKVLTVIVSIWSLFTALTGLAFNFVSLLVVRTLFGAGEAGAFPSIAKTTFNWIPIQERGIVTGINFSGSRLGAAFALPGVAWLLNEFGWRNAFMILGFLGVIWAVLWFVFFRDSPEEHNGLTQEEKSLIIENRQTKKISQTKQEIQLSKLLGSKNMWMTMIQYFCSNFTFFFALTWLFPYIKGQYNLEAVEAGFYTSIPLIFGAIGNWFSGILGDQIYKKGNWRMARVFPAVLGFSFAAIGMMGSLYAETVNVAILFLSVAIFGADMTLPSSWAFCVDIGKNFSGAVSGTMNMAGNVGSFITALVFPYLMEYTGSEEPFFYIAAVLNILAVILWLNMKPNEELRISN